LRGIDIERESAPTERAANDEQDATRTKPDLCKAVWGSRVLAVDNPVPAPHRHQRDRPDDFVIFAGAVTECPVRAGMVGDS
jgi:hypothetical protein